MKITPYILSILFSVGAFAQGEALQPRTSVNAESARSEIIPCSSPREAAADYDGAKRYAIELSGWEQQLRGGCEEFTSSFISPFSWIGRQAYINIESASAPYVVTVGGREVGRVYNALLPAQFEVSRFLKRETEVPIVISMQRDSLTEQLEGWGSDSLSLGAVTMLSQPTMYIRDIEVETTLQSGVINASVAVVVKSEALNPRVSRVNYELLTPQGRVATRGAVDVKLDMRREDTIYVFAIIPDSMVWSAASPNLYRLNLSTQYRSRYQEYISQDVGFRSVELSDDGKLVVNGVEQSLKGVEVPSDIALSEVETLKAKGYNLLELGAGVYDRAVYDYADREGLYLVATAPINTAHSGDNILLGGNPTNDPRRRDEYVERVDAIYNITKNHPSVIAYSLAESSLNGFNLYESYLYLKDREAQRPIIYTDGAGEWNSDLLQIEFDR